MSRALVLAGHGSHLDANASVPLWEHAARIRALGAFDEVRVATWKEEPSLSHALDGLTSGDITVVPVFISAGYFVEEVVPREMGLCGAVTVRDGHTIRYTAPVGSHPRLAQVVIERAREAGWQPGETLAILGHGTARNPRSEANVYAQADHLRRLLQSDTQPPPLPSQRERGNSYPRGEGTLTLFLEQDPNIRDLLALRSAPAITIVPLFIADGWHVGQSIPADLSLDGPETRRGGRVVRYARAVGTHPFVTDVILELANEVAR